MDFDKIKIACICEANIVQGLDWALGQDPSLQFSFELIPISLKDIGRVTKDVDLYFFNLDLGQPVPVESLKAFDAKPGLLAALHPTPHQLLSVFEVPGLHALSWNGQTFEEIISKLSELASLHMASIQKSRFMEHLQMWMQTQNSWPSTLLWTNSKLATQSTFYFDEKTPISIGGAQSGCDICLELQGGYKIAELIFFDGAWRFRLLQKDLEVRGSFDPNNLKTGDFIEFGNHIFFIKEHPLLESLSHLMEQSHITLGKKESETLRLQDEGLSLIDLCKRLMIQNRTGELRVQTAGKYGSIYFVEGQIEDALSGSSVGKKALLRILGWEQSRWKLNINQRKEFESPNLNFDLAAFLSLVEHWSKESLRIKGRIPPQNIRIAVNPKSFLKKAQWSYKEVQILATIADSEKVYEVINNCPVEDHIIFEHLIQFRKQDLISVLA